MKTEIQVWMDLRDATERHKGRDHDRSNGPTKPNDLQKKYRAPRAKRDALMMPTGGKARTVWRVGSRYSMVRYQFTKRRGVRIFGMQLHLARMN